VPAGDGPQLIVAQQSQKKFPLFREHQLEFYGRRGRSDFIQRNAFPILSAALEPRCAAAHFGSAGRQPNPNFREIFSNPNFFCPLASSDGN